MSVSANVVRQRHLAEARISTPPFPIPTHPPVEFLFTFYIHITQRYVQPCLPPFSLLYTPFPAHSYSIRLRRRAWYGKGKAMGAKDYCFRRLVSLFLLDVALMAKIPVPLTAHPLEV
ncbi:hypothetical protein GGR54DRAFT_47762 [Hypoxylon sp. NC1633]|nr:hypothetical protein GGR54DRAFT_47762 [Hypoxylon sp. NC1633]